MIRTQYFHSLGQVQSLVGEPIKLRGKVKKKKEKVLKLDSTFCLKEKSKGRKERKKERGKKRDGSKREGDREGEREKEIRKIMRYGPCQSSILPHMWLCAGHNI